MMSDLSKIDITESIPGVSSIPEQIKNDEVPIPVNETPNQKISITISEPASQPKLPEIKNFSMAGFFAGCTALVPSIQENININGTHITLNGFGFSDEEFKIVVNFYTITLKQMFEFVPETLANLEEIYFYSEKYTGTAEFLNDGSAGGYQKQSIGLLVPTTYLDTISAYLQTASSYVEGGLSTVLLLLQAVFHEIGHLDSNYIATENEIDDFAQFSWVSDSICLRHEQVEKMLNCYHLREDAENSDFAFFTPASPGAYNSPPHGKDSAAEDWAEIYAWTFFILFEENGYYLRSAADEDIWQSFSTSEIAEKKCGWMLKYLGQFVG